MIVFAVCPFGGEDQGSRALSPGHATVHTSHHLTAAAATSLHPVAGAADPTPHFRACVVLWHGPADQPTPSCALPCRGRHRPSVPMSAGQPQRGGRGCSTTCPLSPRGRAMSRGIWSLTRRNGWKRCEKASPPACLRMRQASTTWRLSAPSSARSCRRERPRPLCREREVSEASAGKNKNVCNGCNLAVNPAAPGSRPPSGTFTAFLWTPPLTPVCRIDRP